MSALILFSALFGFFLGFMFLNHWGLLWPVAVAVGCLACVVLAWEVSA